MNDTRLPSAIGVVKQINGGIKASELMQLDKQTSRNNTSQPLEKYIHFLERISHFEENQLVALYWQDKFGSKEKRLVIRKAIVRGYDNINVKQLRTFDYDKSVTDYLVLE